MEIEKTEERKKQKMDSQNIISKMSLKEKISFCTGADFWHTKALPEYDIPAIMMSDGPHGVRCQKGEADMIGVNQSLPATCFPAAVTAGATWNEELYAKEGAAIGEEGLTYGVPLILGPGCNMKRNPLGGRNFEYLSEDPYFAGKMAAAFIRGQQSTGASSSLKHFAVNNQEYKRQNGDSQLDERTLREIYLTAFELAVKEGKPDTVMCAYNKINGTHCSDSRELLTDILRKEWGFDGTVITDWGAMNDKRKAFEAGCDLNMPGGSDYMDRAVYEAVQNGSLKEKYIDASVERILKLAEHAHTALKNHGELSENLKQLPQKMCKEHHSLAQSIAEQGAVLLKNEDHILPLQTEDIVLIGYMAEHMRYQGTGSSHINPTRQENLTDLFPEASYVACCDADGNVTEENLKAVKQAAAEHAVVIVAAGLPDAYESEALDRESMALPKGHDAMIEAAASVNKNTVVVLMGGSAMELPWEEKVKGILYLGLPGQAGGAAAYNLLTGKAVPSGKLTESWPVSYTDVVSRETFEKKNVEYRESIYVGYRYYDKAKKKVRYPFGHGLSYTTFFYHDLCVSAEKVPTEEQICQQIKVSLQVTNTGNVHGAEIVQLYIGAPQDGIFRPEKELKRFARVELEPGETKEITFTLDDRCFSVWSDGWKIPEGIYTVMAGSSSRDIRLSQEIKVSGVKLPVPKWQKGSWYETLQGLPQRKEWEHLMGYSVPLEAPLKKGQFTLDNSCYEMKDHSLIMKIQYKVTENIIAKSYGGKKDLNNPAYRMTLTCAVDCPLRASAISSGGAMSDVLMNGLLYMANGHYLKGIAAMLGKKNM